MQQLARHLHEGAVMMMSLWCCIGAVHGRMSGTVFLLNIPLQSTYWIGARQERGKRESVCFGGDSELQWHIHICTMLRLVAECAPLRFVEQLGQVLAVSGEVPDNVICDRNGSGTSFSESLSLRYLCV